MKTTLLIATLLALAGSAAAGATLSYSQSIGGTGTDLDGDHAVFLSVGDDGSVVILVDGQPLTAPALPEAPAVPELPSAPEVPEAPALPPVPALP